MDPEFLNPLIKNMPLILSFFGMSIGFFGIYFYDYLIAKNVKLPLNNIFLLS